MLSDKSLSVVVPVYNGMLFIDPLISELRRVLPSICSSYELIFVDDGSADGSWDKLLDHTGVGDITCIKLTKNYGQHGATMAGILQARKQYIATMDQDLQHKPADLAVLVSKLTEGFQLIYGSPITKPNTPLRNILTTMAKRALSFAANMNSLIHISAFRLFDARLKRCLEEYRGPQIIIDVVLIWAAASIASVKVDIAPSSKSNYSYLSLLRVTMRVLVSFSTAPLKIASWIGFGMTVVGFAILAYVMGLYLTVGSIPGFPFLASLITIFGGAQLFVFGIFGEYLAKIYEATLGKPLFNIADIVEG